MPDLATDRATMAGWTHKKVLISADRATRHIGTRTHDPRIRNRAHVSHRNGPPWPCHPMTREGVLAA